MSLYAIGDLHLHFQSVLKAPGQLRDRVWKNHEEKLRKNCKKLIYAHCHGESRFYDSIHGEYRGRIYHLTSGDYLRWKPLKIL